MSALCHVLEVSSVEEEEEDVEKGTSHKSGHGRYGSDRKMVAGHGREAEVVNPTFI